MAGPQYIWGPCESKILFTELLIDMLCMEGGALADDVASGAPNHDVESAQLPLACVGFKQALTSLHFVPEETLRCNDSIHEVTNQCVQEPIVKIKDDFAFIIRDHTERAAMARPSDAAPWVIKDKSAIFMDCGASSSVTGSLINTKDVIEKIIKIETADGVDLSLIHI